MAELKRARRKTAAPAPALIAAVCIAAVAAVAGCSTVKSLVAKKPLAASSPATTVGGRPSQVQTGINNEPAPSVAPVSTASANATAPAATTHMIGSRPSQVQTGITNDPAPSVAPVSTTSASAPAATTQVVVPETPMPPISPVGASVDQVVASVDGEPITQRDVMDFATSTGNPIPPDDFATNPIAKKAVKALIGEKLLESEMKNYQDKVDDVQVDKYIAQVRADKHMTDAQFRAQLQASGISYEELRKRARADLQKAMMVQQQVREKIQISNADIQTFYDTHKKDFTVEKERLKLAQILIAVPTNATPQQAAEAQKKVNQIYARLQKGQDFNDLARTYSDDDSKSNGGELGWFDPGDVMDEILAAVKNLKPGQISAVIKTKHGFHIVKLEDHEVPGVKPIGEVRDQIRNALMNEQTNERIQSWIESDLVKKHYVETMY